MARVLAFFTERGVTDARLSHLRVECFNTFFDAIVNERMFELCGEGIRKYDLIRWNLLGTKLDEVKAKLVAMATGAAPYNTLPTVMYYTPNSPTLTWLNSFYTPSPAQPGGSASVNWFGVTNGSAGNITATLSAFYAVSFTENKSELLPFHTTTIEANVKVGQNFGY